ncbi:MAG: EamA family transporter, partial [Gemmatimonadota bacterium]
MDRKHSNTLATKYIAAFGAIYLVWGSTYLAIRFAIETLPPLFMMGARSLLAGGVLYALARLRGAEPPTLRNWRSAAVAGILLFLVGHGGLAWAQQRVTSGVAALISSTTPLWISLLMAAQGSERPFSRRMLAGLVLGFGGVALLAGPGAGLGESAVDPIGVLVLLLADVAWAAGSIYSRGCDFPRSPSL